MRINNLVSVDLYIQINSIFQLNRDEIFFYNCQFLQERIALMYVLYSYLIHAVCHVILMSCHPVKLKIDKSV